MSYHVVNKEVMIRWFYGDKQTTDTYRITTVLRAEIDIITSISASPIEPAVILVIMSVETFNSDVIRFISNVIICLTSH